MRVWGDRMSGYVGLGAKGFFPVQNKLSSSRAQTDAFTNCKLVQFKNVLPHIASLQLIDARWRIRATAGLDREVMKRN
jgi:hypothetical protein